MHVSLILAESNYMRELEKHTVPTLKEPMRLSDYVPGKFDILTSKKGMKKAIEKGLVKINGQQAFTSRYVSGGEVLQLFAEEAKHKTPAVNMDLEVLYEDDDIAVVMKPAGIVVSSNKSLTLENALPQNLKPSKKADALPAPQAAHRLDFPTSGVLLVGKTRNSISALNKEFEKRAVLKTYHAIIQGPLDKKMKTEGCIDNKLKEKQAITDYNILKTLPSPKFEQLHLVELKPHTGRRHQLRIHMQQLGLPILGDQQYGKEGKILKGKGLFLHASEIAFAHPITQKAVNIKTPLPKKFDRILDNTIGKDSK